MVVHSHVFLMTCVVRALQGYLVGNPVTSEKRFDEGTKVAFSHGMGLISDELYEVGQSDPVSLFD